MLDGPANIFCRVVLSVEYSNLHDYYDDDYLFNLGIVYKYV